MAAARSGLQKPKSNYSRLLTSGGGRCGSSRVLRRRCQGLAYRDLAALSHPAVLKYKARVPMSHLPSRPTRNVAAHIQFSACRGSTGHPPPPPPMQALPLRTCCKDGPARIPVEAANWSMHPPGALPHHARLHHEAAIAPLFAASQRRYMGTGVSSRPRPPLYKFDRAAI